MTQLALPTARASTAELFFKLALASGIMVAVLEVAYLIRSPLPYDPIGYLVGRDFANTWLGGRLALTGDPGAHFSFLAYNTTLKELFGPDYPTHLWSYPPHFLLFTWPLALMPYMAAYVVYTTLGLAASAAAITCCCSRLRRRQSSTSGAARSAFWLRPSWSGGSSNSTGARSWPAYCSGSSASSRSSGC